MLRLADCIDGTITIDGVDTARITRERLRSSIALIPQVREWALFFCPFALNFNAQRWAMTANFLTASTIVSQDATMFAGKIRLNLDPLGDCPEELG